MSQISLPIKIYRLLLKFKEGITLSEIAKDLGITRQTAAYNLKCMVKKGQVVKFEDLYFAQPFLYSSTIGDMFIGILTDLIQEVDIMLSEETEVDKLEAISNSVSLLCQSLSDDVKNILTQT